MTIVNTYAIVSCVTSRARSITMEQIYPGKEAWPAERC